jgi:hypothetical protein
VPMSEAMLGDGQTTQFQVIRQQPSSHAAHHV